MVIDKRRKIDKAQKETMSTGAKGDRVTLGDTERFQEI